MAEQTMDIVSRVKIAEIEPYVMASINMQSKAIQNDHSVSILWISGGPGIGKTWTMDNICRNHGFGLAPKYMGTMLLEV